MNILVITLGTRDLQILKSTLELHHFEEINEDGKFFILKKLSDKTLKIQVFSSFNFPEYYTISPREAGQIILENYNDFKEIITYPIIQPVLEDLKKKKIEIENVMLVSTDQNKELVDKRNWLNDTLYFSRIIENYFNENYTDSFVYNYPIKESVTDIDQLYENFERDNIEILGFSAEEVNHVYLIPQGGIDQINFALTLKLIEHYKDKVSQLQKPEYSPVQEKNFPTLFLKNLNKNKILSLLNSYSYNEIYSILSEPMYNKSNLEFYAYLGMKLYNYSLTDTINYYNFSKLTDFKDEIISFTNDTNEYFKLILWTIKIAHKNNNHSEKLWRISMLGEVLSKPIVESELKFKMNFENPPFRNFNSAIKKYDGGNLESFIRNKLKITKQEDPIIPNKSSLNTIVNYLYKDRQNELNKDYQLIRARINDLNTLRNQLLHSALGFSDADIENNLKNNLDFDQLILLIEEYLKTSDMGIFDRINQKIRENI